MCVGEWLAARNVLLEAFLWPEINEPARPEMGKEFDAVSDFR